MNLRPVDPMRRKLFDTRHAVAILDTLRSHYTRVHWSRPDTSQQPVSWKSPFFAQHMHNDLFDSNAESNLEKSLWTLVDSSRENRLVCVQVQALDATLSTASQRRGGAR